MPIYKYGKTLNYTTCMNVYNLELVRKKEIRNQVLPINLTHFIFTVDMLFSLIFFHNVCIFAKTTALFICIFIQKDPSFLPCS